MKTLTDFDLNKLKSELYEEGRAEHEALQAVAEAAERALNVLAPSFNPSEDSILSIGRTEAQFTKNQIEQALAQLATIRKNGVIF